MDHFLYGLTRLLHQGIEVAQLLNQPIPARWEAATFYTLMMGLLSLTKRAENWSRHFSLAFSSPISRLGRR